MHVQDLVQKVQAAGMRLPCLSILGDVASMQSAEVSCPVHSKQRYPCHSITANLQARVHFTNLIYFEAVIW